MKLVVALVCWLFSSAAYSAPAPQDFDEEQFAFDDDSLNQQQGKLSPQGFSQQRPVDDRPPAPAPQPQQDSFRSVQSSVRSNGAEVVRYIYDFQDSIGYRFTYELSDGTIRSEQGAYKDGVDEQGNQSKVLVVQGAFSFIANDGETYWTNYQSDDKGYRPTSGTGGVGGIKPGEDAEIDPNLLKSLVG